MVLFASVLPPPRVDLKNREFMERIARCKTYLLPEGSMISTSPSGNSGKPAALAAELIGARLMRSVDAPAVRCLLFGGGPAGEGSVDGEPGEDRMCLEPNFEANEPTGIGIIFLAACRILGKTI